MQEKRLEIRNIIMNASSLPTLPGIISKLNALSENDKSSVQEMSRLVSSDQVLSARILKLA
ncbi:MAG: HDOD domain-containing protein, partial [Geobacteraceae bacterium]